MSAEAGLGLGHAAFHFDDLGGEEGGFFVGGAAGGEG